MEVECPTAMTAFGGQSRKGESARGSVRMEVSDMCEATKLLSKLESERPKVLDEEAHKIARDIAKDKKRSYEALVEIGAIPKESAAKGE